MFHENIKLLVLIELSHAPRIGLELINRIEGSTGKRPSPGYVYPLLQELQQRQLISVAVEGRKKQYSITPAGQSFLRTLQKSHAQHVDSMIELLAQPGGNRDAARLIDLKQKMYGRHKGKMVENLPYMVSLMTAIKTVYDGQYEGKRAELRMIIEHTTGEIRALARKDASRPKKGPLAKVSR